jgi:hypothetical protein
VLNWSVTGVCLEIKLEATPIVPSEAFSLSNQEADEGEHSTHDRSFLYLWLRRPRCQIDGRVEFALDHLAQFTYDKEGLNVCSLYELENTRRIRFHFETHSTVNRPNLWAFKPETMDELHEEFEFDPRSGEVAKYLGYKTLEVYPIGEYLVEMRLRCFPDKVLLRVEIAWIYVQLQILYAIMSSQLGLQGLQQPSLASALCAFIYHYSGVYCEALGYMWLRIYISKTKKHHRDWVPHSLIERKYPTLAGMTELQQHMDGSMKYLKLSPLRSRALALYSY